MATKSPMLAEQFCNTRPSNNDTRSMNDIKAAEALAEVLRSEDRTILRCKLDYYRAAVAMSVLVTAASLTAYLATLV